LLGYRNNLDKDLVQAYSNTVVVHIISISGLHIAIIYTRIHQFFGLFKFSKAKKWIESLSYICYHLAIHAYSGAAPSILRAAVMFTFILA